MAVVAGQVSAPLRGKVLAEDRGLGIELVRPSTPLSVRWSSGPSLDGTIDGRTTQTIRVFPPVASGSCLQLDATLLERRRGQFTVRVPGRGGSVTYATQSRPLTLSAPLRDGKPTDVHVSLAPRGGRGVRAGLLGHVVPVRVAQCDDIEAPIDELTVELPDASAPG
jgi:hypothetical protein